MYGSKVIKVDLQNCIYKTGVLECNGHQEDAAHLQTSHLQC